MSAKGEVIDGKAIMNVSYETLLYVGAGVGVSFASKKIFGKSLGMPTDLMGVLKLVGAMTAGGFAVAYAQQRGFVPSKPLK